MARKILLVDVGEDVGFSPYAGVTHIGITQHGRKIASTVSGSTNGLAMTSTPRTSGKLFARFRFVAAGNGLGVYIGLAQYGSTGTNNPGAISTSASLGPQWGYYSSTTALTNQNTAHNGTALTAGVLKAVAGDYMDIAVDLDAGLLWFGKGTANSTTWFNSGNPATGANPTYSNVQTAATVKTFGAKKPGFVLVANPFSGFTEMLALPDDENIRDVCPSGFTPWGFVLRSSNEDYISDTGDDPANWYWPARISEDPTYERSSSVHCWQRSNVSTPLSGCKLDNADGGLDYLKRYDVRDLPVRARLGYDFASLSTFTTVARAVVESAPLEGETAVRLVFRGKDALLDKPMQQQVYGSVPATELQGKTKPMNWGRSTWIPLSLVDPANLEYDLTDGPFGLIYELRDQGVIITQNTGWTNSARSDAFGVRRMTNPAGRQAVTAMGRVLLSAAIIDEPFTSWTGDNPTGWTIVGTETAGLRFTQSGGTCSCISDASANLAMHKSVNVTNGVRYWLEVIVAGFVQGVVRFTVAGAEVGRVNKAGTHRISFVANSTATFQVQMQSGTLTSMTIDQLTLYPATELQYLPDWIEQACTVQTATMLPAEVDKAGTITTLATAFNPPLALFQAAGQQITIQQFLAQTLDTYGGGFYFDRLGVLKVGRLVDPTGATSILTLTDTELTGRIDCELDTAPGLTDGWAGVRNNSVHDASDIAGSVLGGSTFDKESGAKLQAEWLAIRRTAARYAACYQFAVGKDPLATLMSDASFVQTEADRFGGLFTVPRYFYKFSAFVEDNASYQLEPFQCVTVNTNRYDLNGGKKLILVTVRSRFLSNVVEFIAWG